MIGRTVDLGARVFGAVLPRARVDQVRRDLHAVLDGLAGRPVKRQPALNQVDVFGQLPGGLRHRMGITRRDVQMMANSFRGRRPPRVVARRSKREIARVVPLRVHRPVGSRVLRVSEVRPETDAAVTLALEAGSYFEFRPGEFLTVLVEVDGVQLKRAYSLSGVVGAPPQLTIKRVPGGRVSNYLNESVAPGASLLVQGPSGSFTPDLQARDPLVLIAGGSGITPIISILESALAAQPGRSVTLLYGNQSRSETIFLDRIHSVAQENKTFQVHWAFERGVSEGESPGNEHSGRLDESLTEKLLAALSLAPTAASYWVCGPTPMREATRRVLERRGVSADRIHEEVFVRPESKAAVGFVGPTARAELVVLVNGKERKAVQTPGQTLLEAGLAAGVELPFSCTMGGCGACRVKLTSGVVDMEEPNCLTDEEREQGYILTCVSRAQVPCSLEVES